MSPRADLSSAPSCRPRVVALLERILFGLLLASVLLPAIACSHKQSSRNVPPAPELATAPPSKSAPPTKPSGSTSGIHIDPKAKAIWTQVGYASWYGPNYNKRHAANGEIYDQNGMTAAHLTLPLNSVVRVVNLKTKQMALVRITDRGPFVPDRIIDLSMGAAKALDVYRPGTAEVRLDVLSAPHSIADGGRWCVQIGAFQSESAAEHLKKHLANRYAGSQVIDFKGPTGWWVRIRVPEDDKNETHKVYAHTKVNEGGVFMVRLD